MEKRNPYAPPKSQVGAIKETSCTRDGSAVVVPAGNDLPPRCIVCNAPAEIPIKETRIYWHSPWIYLLILVNILIYVIVGFNARRTVKISAGLCPEHSARRKRRLLVLLGLGGGGVVIGILLLNANRVDLAIGILFIALLLLVFGGLAYRKVYARKITKEYARLGGCKEPFLASLE